jgi:hypothetical protein
MGTIFLYHSWRSVVTIFPGHIMNSEPDLLFILLAYLRHVLAALFSQAQRCVVSCGRTVKAPAKGDDGYVIPS